MYVNQNLCVDINDSNKNATYRILQKQSTTNLIYNIVLIILCSERKEFRMVELMFVVFNSVADLQCIIVLYFLVMFFFLFFIFQSSLWLQVRQ